MMNKILKSSIKRQHQYSCFLFPSGSSVSPHGILTLFKKLIILVIVGFWHEFWASYILHCDLFLLITEFFGVLLNFVAQEAPHSPHPHTSTGRSLVFPPSITGVRG